VCVSQRRPLSSWRWRWPRGRFIHI
jgi:hypothetical protein